MLRLFWQSELYGRGKWFRKYGRLPNFLPLCVTSDHGVCENEPAVHELIANAYAHLSFSAKKVEEWKKITKKPCFHILDPVIFARHELKIEKNEKSQRTIYFFAHSTPSIDDLKPIDAYINEIKSLPERFNQVDVCLHFHDINKGIANIFNSAGISTVSAGDTQDDNFAENILKIISNYKYCISNFPGTYLYYSIEMGVPFGLHGNLPQYFNIKDANIEQGMYTSYLSREPFKSAIRLFSQLPDETISNEQRNFVAFYLGINSSLNRNKFTILVYKALFCWFINPVNLLYLLKKLHVKFVTKIGRK